MRGLREVVGGLLAAAVAFGAAAQAPDARGAARAQMESGLLQLPLYVVMKQHHPETYKQIADAMWNGLTAGDTPEEAGLKARPIYTALLQRELPKAEDRFVVAAIRQNYEQGLAARKISDAACLAATMSDSADMPEAVITEEVRRREMAWATEMLVQTATRPQAPPPAGSLDREIETFSVDVYRALPRADRGRFMALGGAFEGATDPRDQAVGCAYGVLFLERLLALPEAEAARLFKALMAVE